MWFLGLLATFAFIALIAIGFVWLQRLRFTPDELERGTEHIAYFPGPLLEAMARWLIPGSGPVVGPEALIGETATVLEQAPSGLWVRLGSERWGALSTSPVAAGSSVRVVGVQDLTLLVEPTSISLAPAV